jgi:hypothetical protein
MSETKKDSLAPLSDVSECSTFTNLLASMLSTPVKKRHLEDNADDHSPKRQKIEHSPSHSRAADIRGGTEDAVNRSNSSNTMNGSEPDEELFSSAKKLLDTSLGLDNESGRQEDSDDLFSKIKTPTSKKVYDKAQGVTVSDLESNDPMVVDPPNNDEPSFTSAKFVKEPIDEPVFTSAKKLLRQSEAPRRRVKIGDKPLKGKKVNISDLFDDDDEMPSEEQPKENTSTLTLGEPFFRPAKSLLNDEEPTFSSAKHLLEEESKEASFTTANKVQEEEPLFTSAKQLMREKNNNKPAVKAAGAQKRVVIKGAPLKKPKISAIFDDDADDDIPLANQVSGVEKADKEQSINSSNVNTARSVDKSNRMSRIFDSDEEWDDDAKKEYNDDLLAKYGGFTSFARKEPTNILKDKKSIAKAQKVLGDDHERKAKLSRIFDDDDEEDVAESENKGSDEDLLTKYGGFTSGKGTSKILKDNEDEKNAKLSRIFGTVEGNKQESDEDLLTKYGGFTNFATGRSTNILKNKGSISKAHKVLGDDSEKKAKLSRIFDDDEDGEPEGTKKESEEDLLSKYGGFTNFATGKSSTNILKNKNSIVAAQKVIGDDKEKKAKLSRIFDDDEDEDEKMNDNINEETDEDLLSKYGGFTNFATGKSETNILKKEASLSKAQQILGGADEKKSRLSRIFDDEDDDEQKENGEGLLQKFGGFQNMATKQAMKPPANKESVARVSAIFDERDADEEALEKAFAKRRELAAKQRVQKRQPPAPLNPLEKGKKPFVKPRATVTPAKAQPTSKPVPDVPLASSQDDQISQSDIDLLADLEDFTQATPVADSDRMVIEKSLAEESTTNINNDNVNNEDQIDNNNNVNNVNTNGEEHIDSQTARQIQETLEGIDFDQEFADLEPKQESNEPKEDSEGQSKSGGTSPNKNFFYTVSASQTPKTPTGKVPRVVYSTPSTGNKKFTTPPTPQSTPGTVHRRFLTPSNSMLKPKSNFSTPSSVKRRGVEGTTTNSANGLLSPNVNKQLTFSPNKVTPRKAINYGVAETPKKSGGTTSPSRPNKEITLFNLTSMSSRPCSYVLTN